jgi:hypothetical protein
MSFLASLATIGLPGAALTRTDPWVGGQLEEVPFLFCRLKGRITDHVTCSKIDEGLPRQAHKKRLSN